MWSINVSELDNSLNMLISRAQSYAFSDEIRALNANGNIKKNSRIKALNPYFDKDLLRGGVDFLEEKC